MLRKHDIVPVTSICDELPVWKLRAMGLTIFNVICVYCKQNCI